MFTKCRKAAKEKKKTKTKVNEQAPKGTTDEAAGILKHAQKMWKEISPVCTVELPNDDMWNSYLLWRGHKMAMLTQGVNEVAIVYKKEINPPTIRLSGVSMLNEESGQKKFGKFCGEVAFVENIIRAWPTVLNDAVGNIRLMVDKGEYGRIEITSGEVKYNRIIQYSDKEKRGRWGYVDSRELMQYTLKITGQIDKIDEKKLDKELDSLMEL